MKTSLPVGNVTKVGRPVTRTLLTPEACPSDWADQAGPRGLPFRFVRWYLRRRRVRQVLSPVIVSASDSPSSSNSPPDRRRHRAPTSATRRPRPPPPASRPAPPRRRPRPLPPGACRSSLPAQEQTHACTGDFTSLLS